MKKKTRNLLGMLAAIFAIIIGMIFIALQSSLQLDALEQQSKMIEQTQTQIEDNQLLLNNTFKDMNEADYRNAANLVIGSSLFTKNYILTWIRFLVTR